MESKKELGKKIKFLFEKLANGKPEPVHFVPDKLPTTVDEALELFQKHNPEWWNEDSVKWYKARVRSELIDGNKFVLDATINDGECKYIVGMFDETFENIFRQVNENNASIFHKTVEAAIDSLEQDCTWKP